MPYAPIPSSWCVSPSRTPSTGRRNKRWASTEEINGLGGRPGKEYHKIGLLKLFDPFRCIGEDCFVRAREFIPERWTSSPELVLNASASAPFGTGAASCVGRVLATDIIKLTAARLVRKYTFSLAPGDKGRGVGSEVRDTFMPRPGDLSLCFKLRKEQEADTIWVSSPWRWSRVLLLGRGKTEDDLATKTTMTIL